MANRYLNPFRRGSMSGAAPGLGSLGGYGGETSLFDLHRQMNRLFNDLVGQSGDSGAGQSGFAAPALEIHQAEDRLEITAELPGVRQEDIELNVEDGVLTLSGEKRSSRSDQERGYSERSYGRFERSITLPTNIDEDKCSADFRDGVLTITLPKATERQRGRRIPLGAGQQRPQAQNDVREAPRQEAAQETADNGDQSEHQQQ